MYAHACTDTAVTSNSGFVALRFRFSISSITWFTVKSGDGTLSVNIP